MPLCSKSLQSPSTRPCTTDSIESLAVGVLVALSKSPSAHTSWRMSWKVRWVAAALAADEDIERRFLGVSRHGCACLWRLHDLDRFDLPENGRAHARCSPSTLA